MESLSLLIPALFQNPNFFFLLMIRTFFLNQDQGDSTYSFMREQAKNE